MERIDAGKPPLIFGDGKQTMDFVCVPDIARANVLAAESDVTDAVFNIASGVETSLNGLAETLLKVMGSDLAVEYGPERAVNGVTRRLADTSAASEKLGFEAEIDLEQGLTAAGRVVAGSRNDDRVGGRGAGRLEGRLRWTSPSRSRGSAEARPRPSPRSSPRAGSPRARGSRSSSARSPRRVGAPDAVATTNCTTALHLALYASGVGPGDEVIVPSLSFIATANAVWQCGATPVFADVDPRHPQPRPDRYRAADHPPHEGGDAGPPGRPAGRHGSLPVPGREHDLVLVEDAACAIGALHSGRPIGSLGNLACFSFHPRKVITCGEGGMIAVHDPEVAERLRRLRQHAMDKSALDRHAADDVVIERYPERGWNARMTDLQAAVGLQQLEVLDTVLERASPSWPSATPRRFDGIPFFDVPGTPTMPCGPGSPIRSGSAQMRRSTRRS